MNFSKYESKIRRIHPENIEPDIIREAADVINDGGVIVFPTTYLYGLGADAFNATAIHKIFEIKGRPLDKPLPVMISGESELDRLVRDIPASARSIMERFWPGGVTIIFHAKQVISETLTAGTRKLGIRQPAQNVASALLNVLRCPITGTSANISNRPGRSNISDLDTEIIDKVDLVLDAGQLKGGLGSTVIDITSDPPKVLREGAISKRDIVSVIGNHNV